MVPFGTLLDGGARVKIVWGRTKPPVGRWSKVPRTRWFVAGFLVMAAVVGGVFSARGPFDAHPALAYGPFLMDYQGGKVEQIVQWRDHLEVTVQGVLLTVAVPPDRDLQADLAEARRAGRVGITYSRIPDAWLGVMTPWVPLLLAVAAVLIWATAIVRSRRLASGSSTTGSPQPAG